MTEEAAPEEQPLRDGEDRFHNLPKRTPLADTLPGQESQPVPDPTMGRDTETEFLLRNAGG